MNTHLPESTFNTYSPDQANIRTTAFHFTESVILIWVHLNFLIILKLKHFLKIIFQWYDSLSKVSHKQILWYNHILKQGGKWKGKGSDQGEIDLTQLH